MMTDSIAKSAGRGRILAVAIMGIVVAYLASRGIDLTEEHRQLGIEFIGAAVAVAGAMVPTIRSKLRSIKKDKKKGQK
jgi:uncharacterized membrane protein (DUF441 family)